MRWSSMMLLVVAVAFAGFWLVVPGCGDDDDTTPTCTQALCRAGSTVCCSDGRPGSWATTPSPGRCVCGGGGDADADADADGDSGTCRSELPGGTCNVVLQCGCGAGERCVIGGTPSESYEECIPAGTDPLDTLCPPGSDNCQAGAQCLGTDGVHFYCMQFCYEDTDCPPGRSCDIHSPWGGYQICGSACTTCSPYDNSGCDSASQQCTVSTTASCTQCGIGAPGTGTAGSPCDDGCAVGYGCYTTPDDPDGHCYKFCDTAGGTPNCSDVPGATCQSLGVETYGLCVAP